MSVRLSVCLLTFEVPFKRLFAPTFQSSISKLFRFLESLGKNDGNKRFQILKTFAHKGCKIAMTKKFFLNIFFLHLFTLFKRLFVPISQSPMSKLAYLGCKMAVLKKVFFFFCKFCLTSRIFLVSVLLSASVERCLVSVCGIFSDGAWMFKG